MSCGTKSYTVSRKRVYLISYYSFILQTSSFRVAALASDYDDLRVVRLAGQNQPLVAPHTEPKTQSAWNSIKWGQYPRHYDVPSENEDWRYTQEARRQYGNYPYWYDPQPLRNEKEAKIRNVYNENTWRPPAQHPDVPHEKIADLRAQNNQTRNQYWLQNNTIQRQSFNLNRKPSSPLLRPKVESDKHILNGSQFTVANDRVQQTITNTSNLHGNVASEGDKYEPLKPAVLDDSDLIKAVFKKKKVVGK